MFSYKIVIVPPHSPPIAAAQQTSNLENFWQFQYFQFINFFLNHTNKTLIMTFLPQNRGLSESRKKIIELLRGQEPKNSLCFVTLTWSRDLLFNLGSVRVSVLSFVIVNFSAELSQIEEHGQKNDYNIPGKGKTS